MKKICMKVTTTATKKGTEVIIKREAEFDAAKTSFQYMAGFLADVEKVNKLLKSATKSPSTYVEFDIFTYEYNLKDGYYDSMKSGSYNRWFYAGYPENDNCELDNGVIGYYLRPDIKYTPEHHDMIYEYTLNSITA